MTQLIFNLRAKMKFWPKAAPIVLGAMLLLIGAEIFAGYRALDYHIVQGDAAFFRQFIHNFSSRFVYEVSYYWEQAAALSGVVLRRDHNPLLEHPYFTPVWFYWLPYTLFPAALTHYYTTLILTFGLSVFAIYRLSRSLKTAPHFTAAWSLVFVAIPLVNGIRNPLLRQKNYTEALNLPFLFVVLALLLPLLNGSLQPQGESHPSSKNAVRKHWLVLLICVGIFMGVKEDSMLVTTVFWGALALLARRPKFLWVSGVGLAAYVCYKKLLFPYLWREYVEVPVNPTDGFTAMILQHIRDLSFEHFFGTIGVFAGYTFPLLPVVLLMALACVWRLGFVKVLRHPNAQIALACCIATIVPFSVMLLKDYGSRNLAMTVPLLMTAGMAFMAVWAETADQTSKTLVRASSGLAALAMVTVCIGMFKSAARTANYLIHPNQTFTEYQVIAPKIATENSVAACDGWSRYALLFASRARFYPCNAISTKRPEFVVIFKTLIEEEDIIKQNDDFLTQKDALTRYSIVEDLPDIQLLKRMPEGVSAPDQTL